MKPDGHDGDAPAAGGRYRFDDVVVDAAAHTLSRDGQVQAVEPKVFAALLVLLRHAGQLVPRDDLLDAVWGHRHVTPGVLTRAIAQLRDALGDDAQHPRYIQTQHAIGYRFIGELIAEAPETDVGRDAIPPVESGETPARSDPEKHPALPYAGHERRGQHRAWRWSWPALVVLGVVLGTVIWLDRRSAQPDMAPLAEPSIAVLPFSNLSADRNSDYFAEGLAAEMHDALSGVQGLKVAAPVSPAFVARYPQDVKSLGRTLGVAAVLDASVRREGDRVRINARLSDTGTGYTLWSRAYDRNLSDVFATQTEIADEVLGSLLDVLPQQRQALAKRLAPTRSVAAFDAYLRGLQALVRMTDAGGAEAAAGAFERAVKDDAGFIRAHAGICRAEAARFAYQRDASAYARAQASCERARRMDPGLSEVNVALAELYEVHGDAKRAVEYYARAEVDPARRPAVYIGMANVRAAEGRQDLAMDYLRRALRLQPGNPAIHSYVGYFSYLAGDYKAAIGAYLEATRLAPDNPDYWNTLGVAYIANGDNAAAGKALERSIAIRPSYAALTNLGELRYQSGDYAGAASLHRRATGIEAADYVPWANLGDALLADPATAAEARQAFAAATTRVQAYLKLKPGDAVAVAALGWFRANQGDAEQARALVARSEVAGGSDSPEASLYNAQTLVVIGEPKQAQRVVAHALGKGLPATRVRSNAVLRRAGITGAGSDGEAAHQPTTSGSKRQLPGD